MAVHDTAIETRPTDRTATAAHRPLYGLLVQLGDVDELKDAATRIRQAGYHCWDTHSPFPVHGIDQAMGIHHTRLPWLVFLSGLVGMVSGIVLTWHNNAMNPLLFDWLPTFLQGYDFRVSGKPYWSFPANIPVIFETTVLFAAVAAVIGMLAMNGLPRWHHALLQHPGFERVSNDRFYLVIEARDPLFQEQRTSELLATLGPVERVYRTERTPWPRWIPIAVMVLLCLALFPPLYVYYLNVAKKPNTRIHIIQDMDNQEKFKAQQLNPIFADTRAMRPIVPGTIAREDIYRLPGNEHLFEGRAAGDWATTFPPEIDITDAFMQRGQQQFNIYCAACHGLDGHGNGIIAKRVREKTQIATGWVPPSSLHDATVTARPDGHLYNTIRNGIRTMPPYGDQIEVTDRWAVVAYVRALQRSQKASLEDVPPEKRPDLR